MTVQEEGRIIMNINRFKTSVRFLSLIQFILLLSLLNTSAIWGGMEKVEDYLPEKESSITKNNKHLRIPNEENASSGNLSTDKKQESAAINQKPILSGTKIQKPGIFQRRGYKIDETFILTDKTKANTFRISSEKTWDTVKDKLMISLDIFAQEDNDGSTRIKRQRFELDYKFYFHTFREKRPFLEYCYSTDKSTSVNWKVFSGGIRKKMPLSLYLDIGYGYKWGKISEREIYQYDVFALNLGSKRKISNITLEQNLKTITPRTIQPEKQPIFDYQSSFSIPIVDSLSGTVNFDWRYKKIPTLEKNDWVNYTLKFGLTFIPGN